MARDARRDGPVLRPGGLFFARLATTIGHESRLEHVSGRRYIMPDGDERFLVDENFIMLATRPPMRTTRPAQNERRPEYSIDDDVGDAKGGVSVAPDLVQQATTRSSPDTPAHRINVTDGTYFNAAGAHPRELLSHADRVFDAIRLDEVESRENFLRLGERPVDGSRSSAPDSHGPRGCRRLQHLRVEQLAFLAQIVRVIETALHRPVELSRRQLIEQRGVGVHEQQVFHSGLTGVIGNRSRNLAEMGDGVGHRRRSERARPAAIARCDSPRRESSAAHSPTRSPPVASGACRCTRRARFQPHPLAGSVAAMRAR